MQNNRYILWTNDFCFEDYKEGLMLDYPDFDDDDALFEILNEMIEDNLERIKEEMNVSLGSPIVVLKDINTDGNSCTAFSVINSGNLSECFDVKGPYVTWFIQGNDLICESKNFGKMDRYIYRLVRNNFSSAISDAEYLEMAKGNKNIINKYTVPLGPYVLENQMEDIA